MVALTSFLVLACALAVNAQGLKGACSSAQYGTQSASPIKLPASVMSPGIADWKVDIPEIPQCPNTSVGVKADACDGDVAPTLTFIDKNLLYIHRNGNLAGHGGIVITVYCPDSFYNKVGPKPVYGPLVL